MTERERFIQALKCQPVSGRVPHFELVFFLTMEVLGKVHPEHRSYHQWKQMSLPEKKLHIDDISNLYIDIARKYNHSAIFVHHSPNDFNAICEILESIREKTGSEFFLMMHGDPTFPMPDGASMLDFTAQLYEEPERMHDVAAKRLNTHVDIAAKLLARGRRLLDGFALCADYCFNTGPFFAGQLFDDFIGPYLKDVITHYREMGFYTIKHTDGNIMPILDQLVSCGPDALHSLDPQGGVDLAEVKKRYGGKICLIGNVNCGLLQTGSHDECVADIRRSLSAGMDGYGYIFSTSNCVYTGMPLERYELMHKTWLEEGVYAHETNAAAEYHE